jgi:hypothetical protein
MVQSPNNNSSPVYRRDLPGGGYVAISVDRAHAIVRTRVSVERRIEGGGLTDREVRAPVVIAEADGDEHSPVFTYLYQIAADNAAIARELLRIIGPARAD